MIGTVAAVAGGTASCVVPGALSLIDVPLARHLTPAPGDLLLITSTSGQLWGVQIMGATTAPNPVALLDDGVPAMSPEQSSSLSGASVVWPWMVSTWRVGVVVDGLQAMVQGDPTSAGLQSAAAMFDLTSWGTPVAISLHLVRGRSGDDGAAPTLALLGVLPVDGTFPPVLATTPGPAMTLGEEYTVAVPAAWVEQVAAGAAQGFGLVASAPRPVVDVVDVWSTVQWERN